MGRARSRKSSSRCSAATRPVMSTSTCDRSSSECCDAAGSRPPAESEGTPEEDRLGGELDAQASAHAVSDLACQVEELSRRPLPSMHERQRVLARYADPPLPETLGEPRAFDEPRGRDLESALARWEAR